MAIERKFLPIYKNATAIIRPRTGLQDVFVELDPGDRSAGAFKEGGTIPVANTEPQIDLDQILAGLDKDTQAYLRELIVGGGQGLKGRSRDLGRVLASLGPINKELATLNSRVAERRKSLSRLIHNLNLVTQAVGQNGSELSALVRNSNSALGAIASQSGNVQRAVALLPGTLRTAHSTLVKTAPFAATLGTTLNNLRPFARGLTRINASVIRVATTTPVIKKQIRPFVRAARRPVRDLRPAASRLAKTTPRFTVLLGHLNRLGNLIAYNPRGAEPPGTPGRDEGYLYWLAWLGHVNVNEFSTGDAHGSFRRVYLTASCNTIKALLSQDPTGGMVSGLIQLVLPGAVCGP